jgi:hypothetical protein
VTATKDSSNKETWRIKGLEKYVRTQAVKIDKITCNNALKCALFTISNEKLFEEKLANLKMLMLANFFFSKTKNLVLALKCTFLTRNNASKTIFIF